tara:strand:+ start:1516 stop:1779 length:264 start_codon:yes stop_codon:yes gene_type:complete
MTFDTAGRTMMGVTPAAFSDFATSLGLDACGANLEHVWVMAKALNQTPPERQATLSEMEAKLGKVRKELSDNAHEGQRGCRCRRRRG